MFVLHTTISCDLLSTFAAFDLYYTRSEDLHTSASAFDLRGMRCILSSVLNVGAFLKWPYRSYTMFPRLLNYVARNPCTLEPSIHWYRRTQWACTRTIHTDDQSTCNWVPPNIARNEDSMMQWPIDAKLQVAKVPSQACGGVGYPRLWLSRQGFLRQGGDWAYK